MNHIKRIFSEFPELGKENLYIRALKTSDTSEIIDIFSDEETIKYYARLPIKTKEQAEKYLKRLIHGYDNKIFLRWAIAKKDTDQLIGLISIHYIDYTSRNSKIGYILNRSYWNQNIMTQVLQPSLKFLFEEAKFHRIEAEIDPGNVASMKLAQKLGFIKEGIRRESSFNPLSECYEDRVIMSCLNPNR